MNEKNWLMDWFIIWCFSSHREYFSYITQLSEAVNKRCYSFVISGQMNIFKCLPSNICLSGGIFVNLGNWYRSNQQIILKTLSPKRILVALAEMLAVLIRCLPSVVTKERDTARWNEMSSITLYQSGYSLSVSIFS